MPRLTEEFSKELYRCKDGKDGDEVQLRILHDQLLVLKRKIEEHYQRSFDIDIVSGYRSYDYNVRVGGAAKSQHVLSRAADIKFLGLEPPEVAHWAEKLQNDKVMVMGGVGRYPTFTHVDVRGTKARWYGAKDA